MTYFTRIGRCQRLEICSACCPGISLYHSFTMEFHFPNLDFHGGPWTVWLLDNYPYYVPDQGYCGGPKSCCDCVCTLGFIKYADDGFCTPLYDTCQDAWPYTATSSNPAWDGANVDFFLSCLPIGDPAGCNPPPGPGAEFMNGHWQLSLSAATWPGCNPLPDFPTCGPPDCTFALDCETYRCACPNGFYAKFVLVGPGAASVDPDFWLTVQADDPNAPDGPCPQDWPCPPDVDTMAAAPKAKKWKRLSWENRPPCLSCKERREWYAAQAQKAKETQQRFSGIKEKPKKPWWKFWYGDEAW